MLPQNPRNYAPTTGKAQDQALGTEKFHQNQELFRKYTSVDGALKKQIITAVEPVLLSALVDQLTGLRQVSALTTIQNLFSSYDIIDTINL